MPHFTRQIDDKGALLNVQLDIGTFYREALISLGTPAPQPFVAQGLVDTGASSTCINPEVIRALGISPKGTTSIVTPSTGNDSMTVNEYDVNLSIYSTLSEPPCRIQNLSVMESTLFARQGFHVLIGRDVLARCLLIYDGRMGNYTFGF